MNVLSINACGGSKEIKDEKLHPFLLGGMYSVAAFGGENAFFDILKEGIEGKTGTPSFRKNLHEAYTYLFIFPASQGNEAEYKRILSNNWGVKSKENFLETENMLLNEGHQKSFEKYKKAIEENGGASADIASIDMDKYDIDDMDRLRFVRDNYDKFSASGIKAWDTARYINNLGLANAAGFITEEEGFEMSKKALVEAKKYYSNWDDYFNDFTLGRLFWGGDNSDIFTDICNALADKENAYNIYNYMSLK